VTLGRPSITVFCPEDDRYARFSTSQYDWKQRPARRVWQHQLTTYLQRRVRGAPIIGMRAWIRCTTFMGSTLRNGVLSNMSAYGAPRSSTRFSMPGSAWHPMERRLTRRRAPWIHAWRTEVTGIGHTKDLAPPSGQPLKSRIRTGMWDLRRTPGVQRTHLLQSAT